MSEGDKDHGFRRDVPQFVIFAGAAGPVQPSTMAVVERDRIQPGQPVAAAGAAEGNRNVVINQFAAAAGENRRPAGKACAVLLAIAGGEPSHAALVREHAAADGGFAAASRVGTAARRNQSGRRRGIVGGGVGEMDSKSGKSWLLGSGKGPAGRVRFFGSGTNTEKDLSSGN